MKTSDVQNLVSSALSCHDATTLLQNFKGAKNQLINLSAEVLAILTTLEMAESSPNTPEMHSYLKQSITELHGRGLKADYSPRVMEKVCYLLSAALDEEVMRTWWGQNLCWENNSLVAGMFQQRNAGEVFFVLVNQARQNLPAMLDFLELAYLLLRLGFHGRFLDKNSRALVDLTEELYQDIRELRPESRTHNLPMTVNNWVPFKQYRVHRFVLATLVVLVLLGVGCRYWIRHINNLSDDDLVSIQQLSRTPSSSSLHAKP